MFGEAMIVGPLRSNGRDKKEGAPLVTGLCIKLAQSALWSVSMEVET